MTLTRLSVELSNCECCPHQCGVDRINGETGVCELDARIRVSHIGPHFGEEPPISGTNGSGTVFLTGCNLRCVFCQNHQISQSSTNDADIIDPDNLVDELLKLQDSGAHNINFVSPTHMIFQLGDVIETARMHGLTIPIVYNSNGYDSVEALKKIRGLIDIYLPDLKYMDNRIAAKYSGAKGYEDIIPSVLREMLNQVGYLAVDVNGVAKTGLLVRHLVLPGQIENSRHCLKALAKLSTDVHVSLMSQYSPQYLASRYPEINRCLAKSEYDELIDYALELGLENTVIQEMESANHYLPDFNCERPFES